MMTEKTSNGEDSPAKNEKSRREIDECGDESSWSGDQKKHGYYYDDETNYQIYRPDDDNDEDETNDEK